MMFGMKHSLCFSSIVSNTQPSLSMPTKYSCCGLRSYMEKGAKGLRFLGAEGRASLLTLSRRERVRGEQRCLRSISLGYIRRQLLLRVDRLQTRHPSPTADDRQRE